MRFALVLAILPVAAFCAAVEQLPAPTFADTEVTAHHRLEQPAAGLRGLDFRFGGDRPSPE